MATCQVCHKDIKVGEEVAIFESEVTGTLQQDGSVLFEPDMIKNSIACQNCMSAGEVPRGNYGQSASE